MGAFNPDSPPSPGAFVSTAEVGEGADRLSELNVGDDLGSFTGFLRRASANNSGLTAQFFGENGPDADLISSFHLTRFLDALVHVTVWQVKDKSGRIMRKNGQFPKLVEFVARIRRPKPSNSGQLALFFGENGPHSDAINELNKTEFLDSLVHVQLHKADPGHTPAAVPQGPMDELDRAAQRLTPHELKSLKEQQKRATEAQRLLQQTGFFRRQDVWEKLGSVFEYQDWTRNQACCYPGEAPCDRAPILAHPIPGRNAYHVVPLCRDHEHLWCEGTVDLKGQNPMDFLNLRQTSLIQRWAKDRLRRVLRVPEGFDPTPSAIYAWANENHLSLPSSFVGLL